jgi:hypothetical protein
VTERRLWTLGGLALALGLALWLTIAVGGRSGTPPPTVTLAYEATVDESGVQAVDDDRWSVTTDLGFEVTVDQYLLRTWSAVVTACDEDAGSDALALSDLFALTDLFTVAGASASHSEPPDPAQAIGPVEQDLAAADPMPLGEGVITAEALCGAHVAVAGGEGTGDGRTVPTVEVSGTYVAPGSEAPVPFSITSDQAWGGVIDLEEIPLSGDVMSVLVIRDLSALLDGVDFEADDDDRAAALLRSLTAATRIEVGPAT